MSHIYLYLIFFDLPSTRDYAIERPALSSPTNINFSQEVITMTIQNWEEIGQLQTIKSGDSPRYRLTIRSIKGFLQKKFYLTNDRMKGR